MPFIHTKDDILGKIVRSGSIEVYQAATNALREEKPPETLTQIMFFLVFVNVYRRFILELTKKHNCCTTYKNI